MLPFLLLTQDLSLGRQLYFIIYGHYLVQDTSSGIALVFIHLQDAIS